MLVGHPFHAGHSAVLVAVVVGIPPVLLPVVGSLIGLHLFNDDTFPPRHISSPSQVGFSHNWLSSINRLQNLVLLQGLNQVQNLVAWWQI